MEAEIIEIWVHLFKWSGEAWRILDCSEADYVRDALYAYRNLSKDKNGITKPNILAPNTFNPSFNRVGKLIDIDIRTIQVNNNVIYFKVHMTTTFLFSAVLQMEALGSS